LAAIFDLYEDAFVSNMDSLRGGGFISARAKCGNFPGEFDL
jgi:hypothetical protein